MKRRFFSIVTVCLMIILTLTGCSPKVTNIVLSTNSATITEGEYYTLNFTLFPEKANAENIVWQSADESVATVNNGSIRGEAPGQTTITASADGIVATCAITVKKAGPNFKTIFDEYCNSSWASYGDKYLSIDTNPKDEDDYIEYEAYLAIGNINEVLGVPNYVFEDMGKTTSMMGKQSYSGDDIEIKWSYHPNNGLEVMYSYTG